MVNAFWLDRDVEQAVAWLVDAHVTSSVFECSMVLTTALADNGMADDDLTVTHRNHPLPRWAAASLANWERLHAYTEAAHREWRYRWDHDPEDVHGSWATVERVDESAIRTLDWPGEGATDPPQCTGKWECEYYVDAYRYYYANDKRHLFEWAKDREAPPWIAEYTVDEPPAEE